jgi:hypothetical protein
VIQGKVIAPDFKNSRARLFEWTPDDDLDES